MHRGRASVIKRGKTFVILDEILTHRNFKTFKVDLFGEKKSYHEKN